jgi:hypothetical protein
MDNARPFFRNVFKTVCSGFAAQQWIENNGYREMLDVKRENLEWLEIIESLWVDKLLGMWVRNCVVMNNEHTELCVELQQNLFTELLNFNTDVYMLTMKTETLLHRQALESTSLADLLGKFNRKYGVDFTEYEGDLDEWLDWMHLFAGYTTQRKSIAMNECAASGGVMKLSMNKYGDPPLMDLESNDGTGFKFKIFDGEPKRTHANAEPFFRSVFEKLCLWLESELCYDRRNKRDNDEKKQQNAPWIEKLYRLWVNTMVLMWVENSYLKYDAWNDFTLNIKDSLYDAVRDLQQDIRDIQHKLGQ